MQTNKHTLTGSTGFAAASQPKDAKAANPPNPLTLLDQDSGRGWSGVQEPTG